MKVLFFYTSLFFSLLIGAAAPVPQQVGARQPEIVSAQILKEYNALDEEQKRLIRNYLNKIALHNLYQEQQDNKAAGHVGSMLSGEGANESISMQFTLGADIPSLKKELAAKKLIPLVNQIEVALVHSDFSGMAGYVALFKDLGIPVPQAFNQAIRDQNTDTITLIFEGKNPEENKKIQEALDIRLLTPEKYKNKNLPHNFVILAKRANGKFASAEHIIGKKKFDDVMKANTDIIIKQQPHDMDFEPVTELRVVLMGDQAQFAVSPNKKYMVTYKPCSEADTSVVFTQKPKTFCVREEASQVESARKSKHAAAARTENK